jgi:hypothetical protein
MKRISHLVLVLPLILAAAPLHSRQLPLPARQVPGDPKPLPAHAKPLPVHARPRPVPPIPPAHLPTDGAAPTPNQDAAAPPVPEFDGPKFTPTILRAPTFHNGFDPSQGYVNGSRWQDDPSENRRMMPSPGFNLEIPFK